MKRRRGGERAAGRAEAPSSAVPSGAVSNGVVPSGAMPGRGQRGFVPVPRRWSRILVGAALVAVAVAGNVVVYGSMDRRTPVLQVVRDVPAGSMLTEADVRTTEVAVDPTVRTIHGARWDQAVGRYAKVRIVAGSLLVEEALQEGPLVAEGAAVVALQVADGALPSGLRERSDVLLVIPPGRAEVDTLPRVVAARAVGLPVATGSVTGRVAISVEVDLDVAPRVASSDDVRVVLVAPGPPEPTAATSTRREETS